MPNVQEYRSWLSTNFKICKYEPNSTDDLIEKAALLSKEFFDSRNMKSLVASVAELLPCDENEALKKELETIIDDRYPFDSNGQRFDKASDYDAVKLKLEEIYRRASKQGGLAEKYSKACADAKNAVIFARSTIAAFESNAESSSPILASARRVHELMENAERSKQAGDYVKALKSIEDAVQEFESKESEIEKAREEVSQETEALKNQELEAFRLYAGDSEKMRDMVGNPKVMDLMIGVTFDSEKGFVQSEALREITRVFDGAIKRYDKLKKSGLDPIKAADIALANIPRAFWPDKAIREIAMFERVEDAIALEQAQKEALSLEEAIDRGEGFQDPLALGVSTTGDTMESVLKIQLGLKTNQKLPEVGDTENPLWNAMSPEAKNLLKLQSDFGNASKGMAAFGVFLKGVSAIKKTADLATTEFEGPVQKKIAEFEAKAALFDVVRSAKDMGADLLKDVCPALGVVSSAIDMIESMYLAAKYFKRLHDIQRLGDKAKRDPESVMYLPLIRMDKNERLKAAEQVVRFVEMALATAGKSAQLSGIGAAAGLGVDAAGKIVAQGSKVVFKGIRWSDAKKAKTALAKARAKPVDRKAVERVFKYSNKYATYVIAISAVEDNDTWAIRYCMTAGLKESEVADTATSIDVLRKYIVMEAEVDDDQKTFTEELADSTLVKPFVFIANKIKGSKEVTYEPAEILDEETNVYVPNPKYKNLTAVPGLSRASWQVAKKEAKTLGWYDDKSGMGDLLTELDQARTEWQAVSKNKDYVTNPTTDIVVSADRYWWAMHKLEIHLASLRPFAEDRVTTFEPMQKYLMGMQKLLSAELLDFSAERSVFLEVYFTQVPEGKKQIENEKNERAQQIAKRDDDTRIALEKLIKETEWDSPFGSTTLDAFERLTCAKLGLAESVINKRIDTAVKDLAKNLFGIARDELGGYQPDELPKVYKTLQKNELNSIVYETLEEFASQAREIRNETLGGITLNKPLAAKVGVTLPDWQTALQEAKSSGLSSWKGDPSGIDDALTIFEEEYRKFTASGISHYAENAIDGLRQALLKLEKIRPLDEDGITFEPMNAYMSSLAAKIKSRIDDLDDELEAEFQYPIPGGFKLDSASWVSAKKGLVLKLMKDTSTGIGKALEKLEAAREAKKTATGNKVEQAIIDHVRALDKLKAALNDFSPMTKSKKTHVGGMQIRNEMIKLLELEYKVASELQEPLINVPSPMNATEVTVANWEKAKKEFIKFGLVDEKTGIGKAIKAFQNAKPTAKDEAKSNLLMVIDQAKPLDRAGRVFKPAQKYLLDTMQVIAV
ncbi:hypothetical protein SH501x_003629 [Pirellulaceae bacterium SH501]